MESEKGCLNVGILPVSVSGGRNMSGLAGSISRFLGAGVVTFTCAMVIARVRKFPKSRDDTTSFDLSNAKSADLRLGAMVRGELGLSESLIATELWYGRCTQACERQLCGKPLNQFAADKTRFNASAERCLSSLRGCCSHSQQPSSSFRFTGVCFGARNTAHRQSHLPFLPIKSCLRH